MSLLDDIMTSLDLESDTRCGCLLSLSATSDQALPSSRFRESESDGIPVSVPTVAPQGLQILLADAATQTEDKESPRLLRSKSLPALFTLDLP
ncbi:hypothetical protein Tco_0270257 [Tanacetum coccineum]